MIEKLNFALAALENITRQFTPSSLADSKARGDAHEAMEDLRSVIAEMESADLEAYLYTLEYGETVFDEKLSRHQLNYPFGVCGSDYLAENDNGVSYVRETPLFDHPQPKTEPTKCVKCGDELMSSFASTCYACNQKAK